MHIPGAASRLENMRAKNEGKISVGLVRYLVGGDLEPQSTLESSAESLAYRDRTKADVNGTLKT